MKRRLVFLPVLLLSLSACTVQIGDVLLALPTISAALAVTPEAVDATAVPEAGMAVQTPAPAETDSAITAPSPMEAPVPAVYAEVQASVLRVRWGPSTSCEAVAGLSEGETWPAVGRNPADAGNGDWVMLHFPADDVVGWVSGEWVELTGGSLEDLPVYAYIDCNGVYVDMPAESDPACPVVTMAEMVEKDCQLSDMPQRTPLPMPALQ